MKKTLHKSAALILLSAFAATGYAQNTVPYVMDFTTAEPEGWTTVDKSDTPEKTWYLGKGGYDSNNQQVPCARLTEDPNSNQNDYYVSPGVKLEAGKLYEISLSNQISGSKSPKNLSLEVGKSATDMSENTTICEKVPFGSMYYNAYYEWYGTTYAETTSATFAPKEDGVYYFSMHGTVDKFDTTDDYTRLFVYDFSVKEAKGTEIPYAIDFGKEGMADWYAFDANGTGKTWNTELSKKIPGYSENVNIPYFQSEYYDAANDYFVSPKFLLKAGQSYAATFDVYQEYGLGSYGSPLTLVVGTAKNNEAAFEKVADMKLSDDDQVVTTDRHVFTVAEDGIYYIAAHATGCEINETYVYDGFTGMKLEETDEAPEVTIGKKEAEEVKIAELPYSVTFETTPTDWTIVDKSETPETTWENGSYMRPGTDAAMGMGIKSDYGGTANDYLISPAYKLENGKTYTIDMSYTTYKTGGDLSIELGTDINDISSFTSIAMAQKDANGNKYFPNDKFEFTVPEDGTYYIALHATSEKNLAYVYVFDFAIAETEKEVETTAMPYTENFDTDNFDLPEGWTTIDNSVIAGSTWKKQGAPATFETGHKCCVALVTDNGNQPGKGGPNDYLVSPIFKFEGGKKYVVDLSYITYERGGNLTIELGTDNTDASTFTAVATAQQTGNTYYPNDKLTFTAPEDGNYYVALHTTSATYYAYVYVFDFGISEDSTNGINEVAAIPADGNVAVYTIDGRLVSTKADMSNLQKGTYIMTVKAADGKVKSFKVAK